jgi:hypothetical protein
MIRRVARELAVVTCIALTGCNRTQIPSVVSDINAPIASVHLEAGDYRSVTWLKEDQVIVGFEADPDHPRGALWGLDPDAPQLTEILLPEAPECRVVRYQSPHRLPDGRLGLARVCDPLLEGTPDYSRFSVSLNAVAPVTGASTQLLTMSSNPGVITWTPDQRHAVVGVGTFICQGITTVGPDGEKPFHVDISDGSRHFSLDDELTRGARDCDFTGRADFPAYSHEGDRLAFFASPASIGVEGQARLSQPWNLYSLPRGGAPHLVVSSITEPRGLVWTRDDRWAIFSGEVQSRGSGTWAADASTGTLIRISPQALDWLDLSPDGMRLIGTGPLDTSAGKPNTKVLLMDLSLLK